MNPDNFTPQQPPVLPPHHVSQSMKVIMLVFGLILVGTLGFFIYDAQKATDDTDYTAPKVTTETKNEAAATTTDETADWKTYEDAQDGYSIKYPANWSYKLTNSGVDSRVLELTEDGKTYSMEGTDIYGIAVSVFANKDSKTAAQIAEARKSAVQINPVTITDILVNGESAVKMVDYLQTTVILAKDDKQYWISMPTANIEEVGSVYEKLFTTFKLTK